MKIRRLLILGLCAFAAGLTLCYGIQKFSLFGSIAEYTIPLKEPIPAYTRALRPNYPYSVIPGGAYSPTELQYADREDPVVRDHYADFNMKKAQMVQLTQDKYQYVSYRLAKQVYWTKKQLRIPKGEVLVTDGTNWARSRCGNRLSEKPQASVSGEEPPAKALSLPPMQLGTPMELAETPPLGDLSSRPPVNIRRAQAVLPPNNGALPLDIPPLAPVIAVAPSMPSVFVTPAVPISPQNNPPGTPPTTLPSQPMTPAVNPPGTSPIIQPNDPPVSAVPEPKVVYLFLISFVVSLYGLTRMVPSREPKDAARLEEVEPPKR
jgi:hypothetical protein